MRKIRIGNTVDIRWKIFAGEGEEKAPYDLTGKDLTIYMLNAFGETQVEEFATEGNMILFSFEGKDQRYAGTYQLTLIENEGKADMRTIDDYAFELVRCSCAEDDANEGFDNTISISSQLNALKIYPVVPEIGDNGNWIVDGKDTGKPSLSYDGVAIDSELSSVSTNAVQNKAVTQAIDRLNVYITGFSVNEIIEHLANRTEFAMQQGEGNDICNAIIAGKTILVPYDHDSATSGFAVFVGSIVDEDVIIRLITTGDICTSYIGVDDFRNDVLLAYDSYVSNALYYKADSNPTPNTIPVRDEYGALYMTAIIDDNSMVWTTPTSSDDSHGNADHIIQEQLVSGNNIKTINGHDIIGEGDLDLTGFSTIENNVGTINLLSGTTSYAKVTVNNGEWHFDFERDGDSNDAGKWWRLIINAERGAGPGIHLQMDDTLWENGRPNFNEGGYCDITFICVEPDVILAKYTTYTK
jgi:hypothetical protein